MKRKSILSLMCLLCVLAVQTIGVNASQGHGANDFKHEVLSNGIEVTINYYNLQQEEEVGAFVEFYNKQGQYVGSQEARVTFKDLNKTNTFSKKFTNDAAAYGRVDVTMIRGGSLQETVTYNISDYLFPVDPTDPTDPPVFPEFPEFPEFPAM